ncbi:substrate-binding domain-containing protein [Vibrio rhizosphaerae]|uniref:Autoinducer 2-binding periplasmic protein LuxP n=1 Tax=Vibrio rhizosphaerae TaxID=398736 RepID=A0ABU4ISY7_9VIBR|nr:substrate-binding domain-containing protein [Vibrio rhizosphaerae]MDW6092527.1 substrate-binding domain-containing protein [Vibrio rhizosphaerae]
MKRHLTPLMAGLLVSTAAFANLPPLNSDTETDRIDWSELQTKFGDVPTFEHKMKVGGVSKTLTNEYWRSLGEGYKKYADAHNVTVVYQAAANEEDQLGQLSIAETLIAQGFDALLVSPQTDANLEPASMTAKKAGVVVVNVNDAVMPTATNYVGNVQKDNGVRVAQWFIDHHKEGGKVAVIEGQAGVFAAGQRTRGFRETIEANKKFQLVASVPANWSREKAYDACTTILQQHPDLIGFYNNNDGMALGCVEAVRAQKKSDQVAVFGTDGISDAYASIRRGELTGTVDSFPVLTGEVAMEVALRLLGGQKLPRVVSTPQALITKDNIDQYAIDNTKELRELLHSH